VILPALNLPMPQVAVPVIAVAVLLTWRVALRLAGPVAG
jgi:hypothetical protein